jgi:hypothetical protein
LGGAASFYLLCINVTNQPPAYAYRGLSKQLWVALGLQHYSHPCLRTIATKYGPVGTSLPTDQCYRMSEPQRMKGVWIDAFEGSQFLPGARDTSQAEIEPDGIWLDVETNRIPGLFQTSLTAGLRAFEIEFIGRQTATAGQYGHLGGSRHEIIVDRLISARPVDVAPYARKLELWWSQDPDEAD